MPNRLDEIRERYDLEVASHRPPETENDLPLSYEEISDEWLTRIVCGDVEGARVVGHRLGDADDGTSTRRRIFLDYNEAGMQAALPRSVFCKSSFRLANRYSVGFCGGVEAEVEFYNRVEPQLDIETPKPVWAKVNPDTYNSFIMLHDLDPETEFCTLESKLTEEHWRGQLSLLASIHGRFWKSEDRDAILGGLQTWPQYFDKVIELGFEQLCAKGFDAAKAVIPADVVALEDKVWPATIAAIDRQRSLPHTLIHADVHLRNWYITPTGHMGINDWQCATRGHWGRDLAYTLSTAMPIEVRREQGEAFTRHYLDQLSRNGGPDVSYEEALEHIRHELLPALAWWTVTMYPGDDLPDMQPMDHTLEMIKRITAAISDYRSLS
ncbi:hypothetical protein K663_17941 [Sphingobium sp. MI1205]|nr:hypothetical protein K663_17941 [Sphingobium sp. MI1205]